MAKPTSKPSSNGLSTIKGTVGDDVFHGTDGRDRIFGYEGDDQLFGHGGDDILEGGSGFNYLDGGSGHDTLIGGDDGNTFRVDELNIGDSILGGTGHDNLYASGTDGSDHLIITGHQGTLVASGVSKVVFEDIDTLAFAAGAGDDVLDASAATMAGWLEVRLNGGTGNDTLIGSPTSTIFDLTSAITCMVGPLGTCSGWGPPGVLVIAMTC
jgi:Ca2+-binding RTX toxin-like protein